MEIAIISITAFATAIMTFFSGFGLGTILTPVFMLFFPVELAIALTGIVHFFNNIFKVILVGRDANKEVLIRFGIPAVIAAFLGSLVLLNIAPLSLSLIFNNLKFGKDKLIIGGLLSGFFGGLSGNQGALRSAFLIKIGLSKEAFVGTAVVVSTFVDFTRLGVYATHFEESGLFNNLELVIWATLSAFAGAFLGNKLLKKVTLGFLQIVTAILLIIIALGLGLGIF